MTSPTLADFTDAATRLYDHITRAHWADDHLAGPDPGIRFNARIYRFAKGYTSFIPWRDDLVYAQAQKYWIDANWRAHDLGLRPEALTSAAATATASYLRDVQRPEGYWEYPNPEWRGRIATVEGNYATIGMLMTYARTGDGSLLDAAKSWHDYAVEHIGLQEIDGTLAINYFGNVTGGRVPNNSASAVRTFAMIADASGDGRFLETCGPMVRFMASTQLPTGELPYAVGGVTGGDRIHFLCYQYNAFEFLNIADYYDITGDEEALGILEPLARYLTRGIDDQGAGRYDCHSDDPEVVYYGAAIAAALDRASDMGLADATDLADRAFARVLGYQRSDGSFPYSFRNYRVLRDLRSYPRYLCMILTHLLMEVERRTPTA